MPLISVIIPVHNRANLVNKAVASVLSQTLADFELIIVDDGSTDDIAGAISKFPDSRIRLLVHDANRGASAARNSGIIAARGHYCAFLDSDDYWLPGKLERQIAFMRKDGTAYPISCTHYHLSTDYHPQGEIRKQPCALTFHHMLYGCTAGPGSTLIVERRFLHDIGLYNADLPRLEDWDLLLRAARRTPIHILREPLSIVHFVDSKISYNIIRKCCQHIRSQFSSVGLTLGQRAILASTIENELAAAAYRNQRFGLAVLHFLKSLLLMPRRDGSYFVRVATAIWRDVMRSRPLTSRSQRGLDREGSP
ncbi:MAG: glycosyltransferase family 2 protein [Pseudorhodoplanes sp.]|nr:glycosyltransferase family 2 protein [Pseudorhodoplanes sp.]